MYSVSTFGDRQMVAFSVPPPCNSNLEKGFKELSRIHFYLGHSPIDFMIESVEKASLTDIEKGKIQIYFAVKEIQEFLSRSWTSISAFGDDKLNPSLYFDKAFKNILEHTVEVLDTAYKKPTKEENLVVIETMLGLTQEVIFLHKNMQEVGIQTASIDELLNSVTDKYKKIFDLKGHYENLNDLQPFTSYEEKAKESVLAQLKEPYEFNYEKLTRIYLDDDSWVGYLMQILEEQKDIDTNPDYKFDASEAQELKTEFLTQIKSFNRLLKNGVVNNTLSFSAAINEEACHNVRKSQVSAQSYFDRELNYHKKQLEGFYSRDYHKEQIERLEKEKDNIIQQKIDDKAFYEEYLTVLHRQEKNISQVFSKLKEKLLGASVKDTLTFTGDITNGFVIGEFSNSDKVMLIHKDTFVNVPEAVYAMILPKEKYGELVKTNSLVFDEKFREINFEKASNFWSYGQFLQEISDSYVQKFFLGQEFELMDKTVLDDAKKKRPKF